ncbi:MAG: ribosome recycling factor [Parcubacteria group bacterium]|nr:ribosome recycling factor [Parcubacteria group bacterium]
MPYNFSSLDGKLEKVKEWFTRELSTVRTGRAAIAVLDSVRVESYGAAMPVTHVAGITTEDARTIRVTPWDKNQIKVIEKAILEANLGLSVVVDDRGIRIIFPELTAERREALKKVVKNKLEEARIALRKVRDEVWHDIQEQERQKKLSEDEKFRLKEDMEKRIKGAQAVLEEAAERKEKEISA